MVRSPRAAADNGVHVIDKADRVREVLRQVSGVESVEIEASETGDIRRIEILVSDVGGSRQITRDVESALMSALGFAVDHRVIRVSPHEGGQNGSQVRNRTQLSAHSLHDRIDGGMEPQAAMDERRVRLRRVRCEPDGELYVEITVELEIGGQIHAGQIRDADTPHGRVLAGARSTLRALAPTLDPDAAFILEGVEVFEIGDAAGILAVLRARRGHERPVFHGSAIVRRDPVEAAARAVLDALNRFWDGQASH